MSQVFRGICIPAGDLALKIPISRFLKEFVFDKRNINQFLPQREGREKSGHRGKGDRCCDCQCASALNDMTMTSEMWKGMNENCENAYFGGTKYYKHWEWMDEVRKGKAMEEQVREVLIELRPMLRLGLEKSFRFSSRQG